MGRWSLVAGRQMVQRAGAIFRRAAIGPRSAQDEDQPRMKPEPKVNRYVLVPQVPRGSNRTVRRFSLARLAPSARSATGVDRLERLERVALGE